jgi:Dihaem cytochrome c
MLRVKWAIGCTIAIVIGMQGGFFALHAAPAQLYASAVTPLLDAVGGKSIGALQPGAALAVLGQSGTAMHVAVHGWVAQGANAVVLAAPDRQIVLITGYAGPAKSGASQTVAGTAYAEVTIDGWAATSALVDNVETVWKTASDLFAQKCGSCHALPDPNSLSVNQWPAIMKTQASNAGLDPNETALLTAYLQNHARQ